MEKIKNKLLKANLFTKFFDEGDWNSGFSGDMIRMGIVFTFIVLLNVIDLILPLSSFAYMTSVLTSTSIVLFIAAASHLMRKIFFPGVSVTELMKNSMDHPIGAAIAFLGVSVILSSLIIVNVLLLK